MCSNIVFYSKSIDRKSNDIVNIPKKLSTTDKRLSEMYNEEYYKNIITELERVGNIVDSDVKMLIDK